jgi:hypothetical protein
MRRGLHCVSTNCEDIVKTRESSVKEPGMQTTAYCGTTHHRERNMAAADEKTFGQMTGTEKIVFVGKVLIFLCTFGFAFPTVLHSSEYVRKFT